MAASNRSDQNAASASDTAVPSTSALLPQNAKQNKQTQPPAQQMTSSQQPTVPELEMTLYDDVQPFEIIEKGTRKHINLGFHLDQLKSSSNLSTEAKARIMTVVILHQLVNSPYDTVKKYMFGKHFILRYWDPYTFIKGNRLHQAPILNLDNACKQLACAFFLFDKDLAESDRVPDVGVCQVCCKKNHSGPLPTCYIIGHPHVGGACLNCYFHSTGSKCRLYKDIAEGKRARNAGSGVPGVGREWVDPSDQDLEKLPTDVLEQAQQMLKAEIASRRPENVPQTPTKRKK